MRLPTSSYKSRQDFSRSWPCIHRQNRRERTHLSSHHFAQHPGDRNSENQTTASHQI